MLRFAAPVATAAVAAAAAAAKEEEEEAEEQEEEEGEQEAESARIVIRHSASAHHASLRCAGCAGTSHCYALATLPHSTAQHSTAQHSTAVTVADCFV
jgi:hypothetical protein